MFTSLNNFFMRLISIQDNIVHMFVGLNELFTLISSVHIDLVCNSINVFHKCLSLIEHVWSLINLLSMEVNLLLKLQGVFRNELKFLLRVSTIA